MATPTQVTAIFNRLTALDGINSPIPSAAAVPTVEKDLNGIHTTINQLTLTIQAQLNAIGQQLSTLQGTVNELLPTPPTKIQTVRQSYTVTSADVLLGYAVVPITWPIPWPDTHYTIAWGLHDLGPVASLNNAVGDFHNVTTTGFNAVITLLPAIPLIQGQQFDTNINTPQTLTFGATADGLYQLNFFFQSLGTGDSTQNLTMETDYTDVNGNPQVVGPYGTGLTGDVTSVTSYSIPILVKGGTNISIKLTLTGTGTLNYNSALSIVRMPINATGDAGNNIEVNVVGVHD